MPNDIPHVLPATAVQHSHLPLAPRLRFAIRTLEWLPPRFTISVKREVTDE